MAIQVLLPQMGLTMTRGTIAHWLKSEGEAVAKGEPLFVVETDKLTNEVASEADGILRKIIVQEGEEVPVQSLLAVIGTADEILSFEDVPAVQYTKSTSEPCTKTLLATEVTPLTAQRGERVKASPLAKKIAGKSKIDLAAIKGSGPDGRIVQRDVENIAIKQADKQNTRQSGTYRKRMSAMRRKIGKNMKQSWDNAPVVHYNRSADVTAMIELKNNFNKNKDKISYTDILVKLTSSVLMKYPYMNASIEGDSIVFHDYVNMGIAVALEEGLVVPVVKNTERKSIGEISAQIKDLAKQAREGILSPDNMCGGTFTITNLGMYGIESFTPIINQPESAILGVNAIVKAPVEIKGEIVMCPKMMLSLTADHRLIDGAVAAQFLNELCMWIENPWQLLL